jgi:hypothetical protein
MTEKPRILLCWGYHRFGYVKLFNELHEHFEFVYLNYIFKEAELQSFTDDKKVYWGDYSDINDLLEKVKPNKVLFIGINSPLTILLNSACQQKKIKTIFLQHGIFETHETYLAIEKMERNNPPNTTTINQPTTSNKKFGIQFMWRSFGWNTKYAFVTISLLYIYTKLFNSHFKALNLLKHNSRTANMYLVYTDYCSQILKTRDGVKDSQIIEIGNPEADEIININNNRPSHYSKELNYFLLIDNILAEAEGYPNSPVSKNDVNLFYSKLNQFAKKQGKKLYIKLHPFSYSSTYFIKDPNIVYLRDVEDMAKLIIESFAVFGHNSTLLIPAIALKKSCLFRLTEKSLLLDFMEQFNYSPVLDYFTFSIDDIRFNDTISESQIAAFNKFYLYKVDGKTKKRLKTYLLSI